MQGKKYLLVLASFFTASILPYSCQTFCQGEEIPPCSCQMPPASKGRNREDFLARVRSSLPRWGFCCFLREGEEIPPLNAGLSSWGFQAGKKSPAFCVCWDDCMYVFSMEVSTLYFQNLFFQFSLLLFIKIKYVFIIWVVSCHPLHDISKTSNFKGSL